MTFASSRFPSVLLAMAGTLAAPAVFAQAFDAVRLHAAAPGQDGGSVGSVVLAGTEYPGSDERRTVVLPVFDYQWASGWFAGVSNGLGYNFSKSSQTQFGLRMTADIGRKESRASALRGMGDIDAALEVGGFFNTQLTPDIVLNSSVRYGSGQDNQGLVIDIGADYSTPLGPEWRLGAGTALTLANAEYMRSFFGVNALQSSRSGYANYTPGAGLRDVRAHVSLTYTLTPRASLTGALSVSTLLGDAADSPLTKQRTTTSGLIALTYSF